MYVGQFQNGRFLRKPDFNVTSSPSTGQELVAWTDTYKRADEPRQRGSEWFLGKIVGAIKEGERVRVLAVDTLEGGNIWVSAINERSNPE